MLTEAIDSGAAVLEPVALQNDLQGRLRNIGKLRCWQMAVAEAVTNAFHAVEDSGHCGQVEVEIIRTGTLINDKLMSPVSDVVVRDNGVGFNERNFQSFCTPDSIYKASRGGKGLGRLICLQAFEKVSAVSSFEHDGRWRERHLLLQSEMPVLQAGIVDIKRTKPWTEVKLHRLLPAFDGSASLSAESLLDWLMEHFLAALVV